MRPSLLQGLSVLLLLLRDVAGQDDSCNSIRVKARCLSTFCPDDDTKKCEWGPDSSGELTCYCPRPPPRTCEEVPLSECDQHKCPNDPSRRCLLDKEAKECRCIEKCEQVRDPERCESIPCPENPENKCRWIEDQCTCDTPPPPPRRCEEAKDKKRCLSTFCPDDDTKKCEWGPDFSGELTCYCPRPPPRTCEEVPLSECDQHKCPNDPSRRCLLDKEAKECRCIEKCEQVRDPERCELIPCPENPENKCRWIEDQCRCLLD